MQLFVTGITGHSGSFFIKRMMEENDTSISIKALVRKSSDTTLLNQSGLDHEKVIGDLNDVDLLTKAMQGCDMVLHIASIFQSKHVMTAARAAGIQKAILVHTTGRFSKYKSASAEYIDIEEGILRDYADMELVVLRPTMIYGTHMDKNMIKLVRFLHRHKFFPIFGKGQNLMQPVHAKDLGDAYYAVIKNWSVTKGKNYNLSGGNALPYIEVINTVAKHLGKKIIAIKFPIGLSIFGAKVYNALFKNAIITVEQVMRMMEDKDFSFEEAKADFGYDPVCYDEGIKGEVEAYLEAQA